MTPAELRAIEERHAIDTGDVGPRPCALSDAMADRERLLAEVRRLRALFDCASADRDAAEARAAQLGAELERHKTEPDASDPDGWIRRSALNHWHERAQKAEARAARAEAALRRVAVTVRTKEIDKVRTHVLKTWPEPFQAILEGKKKFEVRPNDRGFAVGDELILKEWDPSPRDLKWVGERGYTSRETRVVVTYIVHGGQWGLPPSMCVMSIEQGAPSVAYVEDRLSSLEAEVARVKDAARAAVDSMGGLDDGLAGEAIRVFADKLESG